MLFVKRSLPPDLRILAALANVAEELDISLTITSNPSRSEVHVDVKGVDREYVKEVKEGVESRVRGVSIEGDMTLTIKVDE